MAEAMTHCDGPLPRFTIGMAARAYGTTAIGQITAIKIVPGGGTIYRIDYIDFVTFWFMEGGITVIGAEDDVPCVGVDASGSPAMMAMSVEAAQKTRATASSRRSPAPA